MIKKQLIMDKSLELFAKQGFKATSIQEITDSCGISKGAFYLSFKSKDTLFIALIDHFMKEVISDIDQLVRESDEKELLYNYYYHSFRNLSEKSAFAKIFIKEQMHFLDNEFIVKVQEYTELMHKSILFMIEKTYGAKVKEIKYDMVYSIQGLTKSYMELILFGNIQMDLDLLAKSLTEKTDLLANYMKTPYIKEDVYQLMKQPKKGVFSKEEITKIIDETLCTMETSIEKESLILLKGELAEPSMSEAMVKGLLENIKHHPNCKWAGYLLRMYFKMG
ncbi:TetR/AcrR family transcriptional regulator [Oceanobacillus sp. FSL H7-0719]|uniref:TetR/AcrR family transcriptional regulator n=1 Tax=Oceanobacillus sp. FSL H7-0719 TaxID=2954507 RepID=UPI003255B895